MTSALRLDHLILMISCSLPIKACHQVHQAPAIPFEFFAGTANTFAHRRVRSVEAGVEQVSQRKR